MTVARSARQRSGALPVHPLLAAAYPVIFLFTTNAAQHINFDALWVPLTLAVGAAAAVLLVLRIALRDWHRAALLTTLAVIAFFGYGHAWNTVAGTLPNQWPLIAWWAVLFVVAAAFVWRLGPSARRVTGPLNAVLALVLLMNGWGMTQAMVAFGSDQGPAEDPVAKLTLDPPDHDDLPDVYYLVFDRYARADVLRHLFAHDNEAFLSALEERGFYVADGSYANYFKTPLSLVSSLEMEYLDAEQLQAEQADGADREPIHRRLRQSLAVPSSLAALGYTYHHVANWWGPTTTNADAHRVYQDDGPTEFAAELLETTLVRFAWESEEIAPFDSRVYRSHHEYQFNVLENIARAPGPKYVFAHMLLPHDPYVFDSDGSFRDAGEVKALGERDSYRRQLIFLNTKILEIVDRILADSERPPIIIIQADEGPFPPRYRAGELAFDWRDASEEELWEKAAILNAYHLPGIDPETAGLYPSITPVNSFRAVFNAYFGTHLPRLEDRIYAQVSQYEFFELFEITDRLRH